MPSKSKPPLARQKSAADKARRYSGLAIKTLADIARDPKAPATARVAAAAKLLERGFGRPLPPTAETASPHDLDDETLHRLLEQRESDDD